MHATYVYFCWFIAFIFFFDALTLFGELSGYPDLGIIPWIYQDSITVRLNISVLFLVYRL